MAIGVPRLYRAQVALEGDLRGLYKDMARAKGLTARTMKEIGAQSAEPKIDLDISSLNKKYDAVVARLKEIDKAKAEATADLDTSRFDEEAKKLEAQKALLARNIDIVVNVDTDKLGVMREELAKLNQEAGDGQSKLGAWLSQLGRIRVQAGPTSLSVRQLGLSLATLGPIITNLVGAVTALAGSLGEALAGGATVAAGALAGFAASAAGAVLAIKPLFTQLKTVQTAQTAYNTAVADYGKNSKEARDAQQKLQQSIRALPPQVQKLQDSWSRLKATFSSDTQVIRRSFVQDALDALKSARALLPTFTRQADATFKTFSDGFHNWMQGLRSPEARNILADVMKNFRRSLPPLMDALGNIATALARISSVGSSFLPGLIKDFDAWTKGIERSTQDTAKLHDGVAGLVDQFRSWIGLLHATGRLLIDVLGGGAKAGKGLVDTLTQVFNRWSDFLETRKGQDDMSNFFHDAVQTTEHLGATLARLVDIFYNLSRGFQPLADGLLAFAKFFGDIGAFISGWKPLYQIIKATGFAMGAVFVANKIQGMIDIVTALAVRWGLVQTAAEGAAAAEVAASVAGGAGAVGGAAKAAGAAGAAATAGETVSAGGVILPAGVEAGGAGAAAGGTAAAAGGTSALAAGATVALPIVAVAAAAKAIDATGLLDSGGAVSKTPLGAILGIGDHSAKEQATAMGDIATDIQNIGKGLKQLDPSALRTLAHDMREGNKAGLDVSTKLLPQLHRQYGSLSIAAANMSKDQRKAFLDYAKAAHDAGEITDKQFNHIENTIGGAMGGIAKDFNGATHALHGMNDVIANAAHKTVPQAVKQMRDKYGSLLTAATQMSAGQRHAFMNIAQTAADQGLITRKQLAKIDDAMTNSQKKWTDNAKKIAKVTDENWHQVVKDTQGMTTTVSKDYSGMVEVTGKGLDLLTSNTNQALKSVGINKEINFHASSADTGKGGVGHYNRKGGIETVPGRALGDRYPVSATVESGEGLAVINRKAMPFVNWLNREFPREGPQRMRKGGTATGPSGLAFALGPYTVPPIQYASDHAGANSHVHVSAVSIPWLLDIGHKIQQMGNSVGEFQPTRYGNPYHFGPVTTSAHAHYQYDHYSGHAVDVNSTSGPENRSWVAGIAHVLQTGSSAEVANLKRVILHASQGGTALQAIGQAHLDRYWKAAKDYLAKHMPSATISGELSGSGNVEKLFAKAAEQLSTSSVATLALGEAGFAESGMQDLAGGDSTSSGALQLLSSTAASSGLDPHDELAIASSFLTNGYGTGHGANYYAAQGLSPQMVAQSVQRSAFSSGSNYAAQEGNARAWMRRYHLGHGKHYRRGGYAFPEYGGSFANGGVVPGPKGAPRTIVAHGGEVVGTGHVSVHVHGDVIPHAGYEDDPVEVVLNDSRFHDTVEEHIDDSLRLGSTLGAMR